MEEVIKNKKIEEMYALNEENLRTILKLRKELIWVKKSKNTIIPQLQLEKVEGEHSRPHSVANEIPNNQHIITDNLRSSLKSMKNVDSFLSQKLQEADKKIEKYEEIIHEGKRKHQALENEIQRKDEALRNLHSTLERNTEKEYSEKQDLNKALHQQRKEFQKQYDILNEQLELKRQEWVNLVNELNLKDQQLRDRGVPTEVVDFDIRKIKDENNKLSREIMICRDEANKFKMHLGQAMKEIDTYKSSIHSYELQCEKLKHLNNELNNTLSEERSINMKGRSKVKDQMVKISSKVEELEEYSANMENTNRDYSKKADYIMQKLCTLKEYIFSNEMPTSRNNKTPGTVRSNISGMISSCSKNPLEFNWSDDSADFITNEIRLKFDELKTKVFNYQSAINKLQGEKQQMYQSMNQLKYESVQEYSTPLSKNQNSLYKNKSQVATSTKDSENKSEAMIEYLRAEVTHLREKNRSLESEYEMVKWQSEVRQTVSSQITDFMAGLLKPAKDLIYQLCSDPHLSESYFYTEDEIFEGIDSKYCLDIVKLFDVATERIVDLRSTLDQKEQIIRELDKKIIEIKLKYDQILQQKQKQEQSMNKEIEINFEGLDTKWR